MTKRWTYHHALAVAIIGLLMVGAGFVLAYLSDPARFSDNVRDDLAINLFSGSGFLVTLLGLVFFMKAVAQITFDMSAEVRRDVNLGLLLGIVVQASGFFESNPLGIMWCYLASLVPLCWASMRFAQAKGCSKAFGTLGIFGIAGLIVLLLLPVRNGQAAR